MSADANWPKGCRKVSGLTAFKHDNGLIYLTMRRVNRGTGYEDFTELGAMAPEDFEVMVQAVADLRDQLQGRGRLLVESLGGLKL